MKDRMREIPLLHLPILLVTPMTVTHYHHDRQMTIFQNLPVEMLLLGLGNDTTSRKRVV
jgi:hypothetical protein